MTQSEDVTRTKVEGYLNVERNSKRERTIPSNDDRRCRRIVVGSAPSLSKIVSLVCEIGIESVAIRNELAHMRLIHKEFDEPEREIESDR